MEEPWRAEAAVAGLAEALQSLRELVLWPTIYAEQAAALGLKWPRGLLLHGPPGTGKTSLVHAIVRESGAHLINLSTNSIMRPYAGETERLLREAFTEARAKAANGHPSIIFIDEIDALCPHRDARRQQEARIVAQLLTLMDGIPTSARDTPNRVVVLAATNRVNAIDPALRRPGRFDREILLSPPSSDERYEILRLKTQKLPLAPDVDLRTVAAACHGYVGADLQALCREAATLAMRKNVTCGDGIEIKPVGMEEWTEARGKVGPSIVRGFAIAEVPKVSWDDIGGLQDVKKRLRQSVEWPLKHADAFARLGLKSPRGVLLHGPPGCCKTTLVRAAAHAADTALISLSGAELYSMYVGEGEALLRETFQRARLAAPCMVFFDEVDVLGTRRAGMGAGAGGTPSVGEKLLSTLLTEMDGLELAQGVLVLAATNRKHAIDSALIRPGRFDVVIYVPPPDVEGRLEVLRIHTRSMKLSSDVNLSEIAENTERFSGAELASICREAGMAALRENINAEFVSKTHFDTALRGIKPALTTEQIEGYATASKPAAFSLSEWKWPPTNGSDGGLLEGMSSMTICGA